MSELNEMPHEEFVRLYREGALDVQIPEEVVDEVLAKRDIRISKGQLNAIVVARTIGVIAFIVGGILVVRGLLLIGVIVVVVGAVVSLRSDRPAGQHVLTAVLANRDLYSLLQEHHGIWISRKDS